MTLPKRSPAFWVMVVLGGAATCCGLPMVALAAMGLAADDAPAASGDNARVEVDEAAQGGSDEVDDFVYKSPNGMSYIAASTVAAEGVPVTLVGEWRDDHRHITLRLKNGGRYELTHGGGVLVGEKVSNAVAYGARDSERGTWSFEESALTLTPEGHDLSGSVGLKRLGSDEQAADGPRAWTVVGVTLSYTPEGQTVPRQRPALHIRGPSPEWYYPVGTWDLVLRSAPWSG